VEPEDKLTLEDVERAQGIRVGLGSWLIDRPVLVQVVAVLVAGALGALGLASRVGPQPVGKGLPGFLYGSGIALVVVVIVNIRFAVKRRRRERG